MQMDTKPRSGFSDTVSLSSVSEITEDRSIALRIDGPNLASINTLPYWRILVLDRYEEGEFSLSKELGSFRAKRKVRELSDWAPGRVPPGPQAGEQWTFYFEGGVSRYLPLPTRFRAIRFTRKYEVQLLKDLHVIGLDSVQRSTFSYQMDNPVWTIRAPASNRENKQFSCHSNGCDHVKEQMSDYPLTTLNLGVDKADRMLLGELNAKLTGNADISTAEYSERVMAYLRDNFRYSLNPDGVGGAGDPIVNWLSSGSSGHCELYAGAFVLMAREAGYPARMVVGFVGGSWNSVENFFVVRNSDAHAWAEIYDYETKEWLRVDPTPGNSNTVNPEVPAAVDFKFEIETGMWAWVDSLRMQWYRRVISFDQDDQVELATSLIDLSDSFLKELSTRFKGWVDSLKAWAAQPFSRRNLLRLGVALGICAGAFVVWRSFFGWSHMLFRLMKKTETLSPIRKQATRYMAKVRMQMKDSSTDEAYFRILQNTYAQLEALRFGPNMPVKAAIPVFKETRRVLRRRKRFSF